MAEYIPFAGVSYVLRFTPQPESHIRKGMDEWLSGGIPLHGRRRNPETKEAMAVRPWSFTDYVLRILRFKACYTTSVS
jgi:hypothetical protein